MHADRIGFLTGKIQKSMVLMVEVRWGTETKYEAIEILELVDAEEKNDLESLVAKKRYERIEHLRSLMTYEKLTGSLSNVMYSMRTAEIDFMAHQFVPVLKFVNSPTNRLLIADEVGLGKTIEAGLIWTECRARFQARRLLVVCPPSLIPKWIRELKNRFSVDAQHVDAKGLHEHFTQFANRGAATEFALVTSYHALRPRKQERKLLAPWLPSDTKKAKAAEENETAPKWNAKTKLYRSLCDWTEADRFLDLIVFDEAHMMKNTATANHLVGEVFSSAAQALLALSATPLTTKTRDLYALLKLVDRDIFNTEGVFKDLSARNVPAVKLARELQGSQIDKARCLELLDELAESQARDHLKEVIEQAPDLQALTEEKKVDLLGKANRLNELGNFLLRTRKVEISAQHGQKWLVFSIDSDFCFYPEEQSELAGHLEAAGVDTMHITVHSDKGHDSFLLEPALYTPHIAWKLSQKYPQKDSPEGKTLRMVGGRGKRALHTGR